MANCCFHPCYCHIKDVTWHQLSSHTMYHALILSYVYHPIPSPLGSPYINHDIIGNNIIHHMLLELRMALREAICIPATAIRDWVRENGPSVVLGNIHHYTEVLNLYQLHFLWLTCFLTFYCDPFSNLNFLNLVTIYFRQILASGLLQAWQLNI